MILKNYQRNVIEQFQKYLNACISLGPNHAFYHLTEEPYNKEPLQNIPYVCIKIPTGGGKTIVATQSIYELYNILFTDKKEKGIVLWFTPSETIQSQTLNKLKNRNDVHRKILDDNFNNQIKIFSNEEALTITPQDINNNLCIIVSSQDAFRKADDKKDKYKVYQENGKLISHFDIEYDKLERDSQGTIISSLANVIRLHNPIVLIDEGHRTKTTLSLDTIKGLNPAFVLEFTATPRENSNILVEVHASELKKEHMVKIPIVLESVSAWQEAINRGVKKRTELEATAKKEKGVYIRPIALLQAEQDKDHETKVTVQKIKNYLIKEEKIDPEHIAIKTAMTNEIQNIDLFNKDCQIRYLITVNALAEGWDCSFAYLLISVANVGAKVSVEQIIGRILRLPHLKEHKQVDLNNSYIFASAKNFNEAATQVIDGLEKNGYSRSDFVSVNDRIKPYAFDVKRKYDHFAVPMFSYESDVLGFSDLIDPGFKISNYDTNIELAFHFDSDGKFKLDINDSNAWVKERQTQLVVKYDEKDFSENELIIWLDKHLKFDYLLQDDKVSFVTSIVKSLRKKEKLSYLSNARYVLRDRIYEEIMKHIIEHTKESFTQKLSKKKIILEPFEGFPETITLTQKSPVVFKKSYYESVDKLNGEEMNFVDRLDSDDLENIEFWVRNKEKEEHFFLQGWLPNKFYPDFVAKTKKGTIIALEWKGEDRISNDDTAYKQELAKIWETTSQGKLRFFLVSNKNVEDVLTQIKKL